MRYLLSIGSNLGSKEDNLEAGISALNTLPHSMIEVSSFYRTAAMYRTDQPDFLNAAVLIDTTLGPHNLLLRLQAIENYVGRERAKKYGPRVLDIDIVGADDEIIATETLCVPHPLMHERRFVLEPLLELAPDWKHPTRGATVREMLEQLSDEG
ncbi:MAG: 2-amino-4-hydroxy-6-hydroxymethyldihydropteridine diphosphokinase [Bradymonadia bacterium]